MGQANGSAAVRSDSPAITSESVERALAGLIPDELRAEINSLADEWETVAKTVVEAIGDLFDRTLSVEKALGFVPCDHPAVALVGIDQSALNEWLSQNTGLERIITSRAAIEDAAEFYDPTARSATRDVRDVEDLPRPVRDRVTAARNGESRS